MDENFEQLVIEFDKSPFSTDVIQKITSILKQQTDQSLSSFISQAFQSLLLLEQKIWQLFCQDTHEWLNDSAYSEFFRTLSSFNKTLIFNQDDIKDDIKVSLLAPDSTHQINNIFQQIEQSNDDNDLFITFISLWVDNLSFYIHEYPQLGHSAIIIHMNHYLAGHFVMSEQFKSYLIQLQQPQLSSSVFTAKQLFYMKTCPLSLNAYFYANPQTFDYTPDQIIQNIGDEYLKIVEIQSSTVDSWSKELLTCMTHLIGFMRAFLWWEEGKGIKLKILFPTEKLLCEYIQAIIRIIDHKPFYKCIMSQWINDETILLDSALLFLINIVQTQNINWYFQSISQLPDILLTINETDSSIYYRISLCAYGILSEILTDEHLKNLKITHSLRHFFFNILEQAWHSPTKKYKQIPITYLLRGFSNLSKNDLVQQNIAEAHKISFFIEMCDQFPIVFDIIWGLSFNSDIQQQLRSSTLFMSKLAHLEKESDDEQMRKIIHGILWNLEIKHEEHSTSEINDEKTFDIMISYCHKEQVLCKQLYQELTKAGYRVWVDFDQMHGNVMDAMAQAIEQSHTIIICMSEEYRKSNYCRAEAHYAFQRQRKIVPILSQEHYKPEGWLLFLLSHLFYVDFIRFGFDQGLEMLFKELKTEDVLQSTTIPARYQESAAAETSIPPVSSQMVSVAMTLPQNMLEWTQAQVQGWLTEHNLTQMSRLLVDCDGRTLVYLNKYMKYGQPQEVLSMVQEDLRRRTNEKLSLIELSCFHSLMDQQRRLLQSTNTKRSTRPDANTEKKRYLSILCNNYIIDFSL